MASRGTLTVRIVGDPSAFERSMDRVKGKAQGFGADLRRIGGQIAAAAAAATAAFAKSAVDAASGLEQSMGAVETVFGSSRGIIDDFAAGADRSFGLSIRSANEMAARIGASLQGLGFDVETAAGITVQLEERGADLAATFGGPVSDAVDAIGSLLRGERDPIERYGVAIKQSDVNARLAAEGLDELEGEARKQAEAQAALAMLFEQTAASEGTFARESATLAGQQERLKAQFENLSAEMGEKLLPHIVKLAEWAGENLPAAFEFAEAWIGRFVGAIQGAARWAADLSVAIEDKLIRPAKDGFRNLAEFFGDVWDAMVSIATTAVNNIIGAIESMLQGLRNGLQALRNVADFLPGISLPDIPNVNLPRVPTAQPSASTVNVTVNMPPQADPNDVIRIVRQWEQRNGTAPIAGVIP